MTAARSPRSFLDDLRAGKYGLRFVVPDAFQVVDASAYTVLFRDETRHIDWHVLFSPFMLDLRREYDRLLREDADIFLRGHFTTKTARTADSEWSPLVDLQYVSLRDAPGLLVIYRTAYEPGNEGVIGELYFPVRQGLIVIGARSRAGITGLRESFLTTRLLNQGAHPSEAIRLLSQADIDDPQLDERFPEHPLSLVRTAMRWVMEEADLEVIAPMVIPDEGEIALTEADCAVVLPPRYVVSPLMSQSMAEGLIVATRACPPGSSMMWLQIARLPGERLVGWRKQGRLKRLAIRMHDEWQRQGATGLKYEVKEMSALNGRVQIETYATFRSGPELEVHSVIRWFVDTDGQVFRVGADAPPFVGRELLLNHVESVVQSWRRLSTA
jgi:hypothetical protein